MKKNNLWEAGTPKTVLPGVMSWENCLTIPEGVIDLMNKDVDNWVPTITQEDVNRNDSVKTVFSHDGPIRFNPELEFTTDLAKTFFKHVRLNTLNKVAQYIDVYTELDKEINWMENWQYITYKPPRKMDFHSDNHAVRNPKTNKYYINPFFRRITILTYLNDDFDGGALVFRHFKDYEPYKPPAGSVVVMPSNYMYSHATTPLLNGRKAAFLVSCSSNYDMDSYNNGSQISELKRRELR